MKTTRRIVSLLLAMVMLLSCCFSALAQGDAMQMSADAEQPVVLPDGEQPETPADTQQDDTLALPTEEPKEDVQPDEAAGNDAPITPESSDEPVETADEPVDGDKTEELADEPVDEPEELPDAPLTATLADAVVASETATFEVTVSDAHAAAELAYRWQSLSTADLPADMEGDALAAAYEAAWADVDGETAATLILEGLTDDARAVYEPMRYRCVVTMGEQSVTTNEACVLFADVELMNAAPLAEKTEVQLYNGYAKLTTIPLLVYNQSDGIDYAGMNESFAALSIDGREWIQESLTVATLEWKEGEEALKEALSIAIDEEYPHSADISVNNESVTAEGTATFTLRLENETMYAKQDITISAVAYDPTCVSQKANYLYIDTVGAEVDLRQKFTDVFDMTENCTYGSSYYGKYIYVVDENENSDLYGDMELYNDTFTPKKSMIYTFTAEFYVYYNGYVTYKYDVIVAMPYALHVLGDAAIKPGETLQIKADAIGSNTLEGATWAVTGSEYATITQEGLLSVDEACKTGATLTVSLTPASGGAPATINIELQQMTEDGKQVVPFSEFALNNYNRIEESGFYALPENTALAGDGWIQSSYEEWGNTLSVGEEEIEPEAFSVTYVSGDENLQELLYADKREDNWMLCLKDPTSAMVGTATFRIVAETQDYYAQHDLTITVKPYPNIAWPKLVRPTVLIANTGEEVDLFSQNILTGQDEFEALGGFYYYYAECPTYEYFNMYHSRDDHPGSTDPKEQFDFRDGRYFTPYANATFAFFANYYYGLNLQAYLDFNVLVGSVETEDNYALKLSTKKNTLYAGESLAVTATFNTPNLVKDKSIRWELVDENGFRVDWEKAYVSTKGVVYTSRDLTEPIRATVRATPMRMGVTATLEISILIKPTSIGFTGYEDVSKPTATLFVTPEDPNPTFNLGAVTHAVPVAAQTGYTFKSSKPKVATVGASGIVKALTPGTTVITVTSTANQKAKATFSVNVEVPVAGIRIAPKSGDTLRIGQSMQFVAEFIPALATDKRVEWSVSPENKGVTITEKGLVKCAKDVEQDTVFTITATALGCQTEAKTTSYQLTVKTAVQSVKLGITSYAMDIGDVLTEENMGIVVTPEQANTDLLWTLNKQGIVRLDAQDGQRTVVAQMPGTVTLTVAARDGSNKKATLKITVRQPVEELEILADEALNATSTLTAGTSTTLKAQVHPTSATNKKVTWSSSNETIAKVSASGKVTVAKGASGNVTITATAQDGNGASDTYEFEVTSDVPESLSIMPDGSTDLHMPLNNEVLLLATCTPSTAAASVKWTTSNKKVATVSGSGYVTFVKPGTVTITATSTVNKKLKATYTLMARANDVLAISDVPTTARNIQTGQSIMWSVRTTGGEAPFSYEYSVYNTSAGETVLVKKQKTKLATYTYKATKEGVYAISVTVTDAIGQTATFAVSDNANSVNVQKAAPSELHIQNVTMVNTSALNRTGGEKKGKGKNVYVAYENDNVRFTVDARGGTEPYTYKYSVQDEDLHTSESLGAASGNVWDMGEWANAKTVAWPSDKMSELYNVIVDVTDTAQQTVRWQTPVRIYRTPVDTVEAKTLSVGDVVSFSSYYQAEIDGIASLTTTNAKVVKLNKKTGEYTVSLPGTCTVIATLMSGATIVHNVTVPELCVDRAGVTATPIDVGTLFDAGLKCSDGKAPYTAQLIIKNESGKAIFKGKTFKDSTGEFAWDEIRMAQAGDYTFLYTVKDAAKKTVVVEKSVTINPASTTFSLSGVEQGGGYARQEMPLVLTGMGSGYERVRVEISGPEGFVPVSYTLAVPFTRVFETDAYGNYELVVYDAATDAEIQTVNFELAQE